ncbi:MAG: pyridoxal 5'-phosphate synthase glutaminase subunit PdxT [Patescibacteria group bacterium]
MNVGILAFQGDISEHAAVLRKLKQKPVLVRTADELAPLKKLIIPGGESTVIAAFLERTGLGKEIQKRVRSNSLSVFGTCAGAILLSKKARGKNAPKTLGLMDAIVDRNAYGSQHDSFEGILKVKYLSKPLSVAFIRAPVISSVRASADVLAEYKKHPVIVRQGNVLIATCHPEVRGETQLHEYFLGM